MTLRNLSKILDKYEEQLGYTFGQRFDQLKNLPFYKWSDSKRVVLNTLYISKNSNTFNNAIDPKKNGVAMPLFDAAIYGMALSKRQYIARVADVRSYRAQDRISHYPYR